MATGGYGRREVCPYSDIDITICYLPGLKGIKEVAATILYPLWDSGLKVGHSVMTPKEAIAIASAEVDEAVSHLDSRQVAGAPSAFQELSERMKSFVSKRHRRIAQDILEKRERRLGALPTFDGLRCAAGYLRADLKLGSGGLRDICAVEWMARCLGIDVNDVLTQEETRAMLGAKSDLLLLRAALHLCYRRCHDVLDAMTVSRLQARFGEALAQTLTKRAVAATVTVEVVAERALRKLMSEAGERNRFFGAVAAVTPTTGPPSSVPADAGKLELGKIQQTTSTEGARRQLFEVLRSPL